MRKIILAVVLMMILAITGCKVPEEAEEPTVTEPTPEVVPVAPKELVSGLKCENNVVSGTITNIGKETIDMIKDVRVLFNQLPVAPNLIGCEKTSLKAGESTVCSKLNGVWQVRETNTVMVKLGTEQVVEEVTCRR